MDNQLAELLGMVGMLLVVDNNHLVPLEHRDIHQDNQPVDHIQDMQLLQVLFHHNHMVDQKVMDNYHHKWLYVSSSKVEILLVLIINYNNRLEKTILI